MNFTKSVLLSGLLAAGSALAQEPSIATNTPALDLTNAPPPVLTPIPVQPPEPTVDPELRRRYLGDQGTRLGSPRGARTLEPAKHKRPDRIWHGELEVGATGYRGNTDSDLLMLKLKNERKNELTKWTLGAQGFFGKSEGERNRENAGAEISYRHNLEGRYYYAAEARLYYDGMADLDYQATALLSLGYDLVKSDDTLLAVEAGPAYITEKKGGEQKDFVAARLAATVDHLINERVLLWERVEYLPALNETDFYLVLAEVGVESSLSDWLNFRTAAQLRYDSAPAADKEETDLFMTASLVAVY
jgi:putative salt-induced outer membrane protein YdiY